MSFYDEIEIEDMTYHESTTLYTYPCPCGDQFEISLSDLRDGEEVAVCPSCSLMIKVIFEAVSSPESRFMKIRETETCIRIIYPRETAMVRRPRRRQRLCKLRLEEQG